MLKGNVIEVNVRVILEKWFVVSRGFGGGVVIVMVWVVWVIFVLISVKSI